MGGLRNKSAFKCVLQVFILSQKHKLGVKKVVWCGLDVVWGGLEVVWGVLGWFGVFPRTDDIILMAKQRLKDCCVKNKHAIAFSHQMKHKY